MDISSFTFSAFDASHPRPWRRLHRVGDEDVGPCRKDKAHTHDETGVHDTI